MDLCGMSKFDDQISSLQTELVTSFRRLSDVIDEIRGSSSELSVCAGNIRCAEENDDEEHKLVDKAYDDYQGELEHVKDKIKLAAAEIDVHVMVCSNLRLVLDQMSEAARKIVLY